jgi:hypothetical protein
MLTVEARFECHRAYRKSPDRRYQIEGFSLKGADEMTFMVDAKPDRDSAAPAARGGRGGRGRGPAAAAPTRGVKMTIAEYFKQHHKITLRCPKWPLVAYNKKYYMPLELITVRRFVCSSA